jgi:hypothetical protein
MSEEFDPIQRGEIAFRLDLTAAELKVTHTALKSLLDDFGHEEHEVQELIRAVLDKTSRAIESQSIGMSSTCVAGVSRPSFSRYQSISERSVSSTSRTSELN